MLDVPEDMAFQHPSSILYFKVADIQAAYGDLRERGVKSLGAPHVIATMPPITLRMVFFHDTEGNTHALMSEVAVTT